MIVKLISPIFDLENKFYRLLNSSNQLFVILDWTRLGTHNGNQRDQIPRLLEETYSVLSGNLPTLVIDTTAEGPTIEHLEFLLPFKQKYPSVNVIHITSGQNPEKEHYQVITDVTTFFWPMLNIWADSFSRTAQHHFISLARAPKLHRIKFTDEMLHRHLDQYGFYSIGSAGDYSVDFSSICKELELRTETFPSFPVLFDGVVSYAIDHQYNISDTRISQALVNVVLETSYEKLSNRLGIETVTWRCPFITEKTVKAFALGQIPLVLGPLHQVKMTRDLGFDMFDDIVDNSYDLIVDPKERIVRFTDSLEQFIKRYPKESLQGLKDQLMPRFETNRSLAIKMATDNRAVDDLKKLLG